MSCRIKVFSDVGDYVGHLTVIELFPDSRFSRFCPFEIMDILKHQYVMHIVLRVTSIFVFIFSFGVVYRRMYGRKLCFKATRQHTTQCHLK